MRFITNIVLLLLLAAHSSAQLMFDTVRLQEIIILERHQAAFPGMKTIRFDSTILKNKTNQSLAEFMNATGQLQVRSQGPGALATSSYRGAGSSHTSITWNGLDINSPTLGQTDLSPIPMSFIDDLEFGQMHSDNKALSSSNIGFLQLKTNPEWDKKFQTEVFQSLGSFNSRQTSVKTLVSGNKLQSISRYFHSAAKNDFPFKFAGDDSVYYRKNAGYELNSLLEEVYFKPLAGNLFSFKTWIQETKNQIPSQVQTDRQSQKFLRTQLGFEKSKPAFTFHSQLGFIDDRMNYQSGSSQLNYITGFRTIQQQSKLQWNPIQAIQLETGYFSDYTKVLSDNFSSQKERFKFQSFVSSHWNTGKIAGFILINQHFEQRKTHPFVPSLGLEYKALKKPNLVLKTAFSQIFRAPGMNDLYWNADNYAEGNPGLQNETGYNAETGIEITFNSKKWKWKLESTLFFSRVEGWIVWMQGIDNNPRWKPYNLKNIERKGLEINSFIRYSLAPWDFSLQASFNTTSSKNLEPIRPGDGSGGKQLLYVPQKQAQAQANIKYLQNEISVQYQGNGISYSTTDNSAYLKPWNIVSVKYTRSLRILSMDWNLGFACNNLGNTSYSILQGYPMPGRWYEIHLRFSFSQKKAE